MLPFVAEQEQAGSSAMFYLLMLAPLLILFLYMWWSGKRRARVFEESQAQLAIGQDVATTSGLYGRIVSLDEEVAGLEVSAGVVLRFDRRAVVQKSELPANPQRPGQAPEQRPEQHDIPGDDIPSGEEAR